MPLKTNIGREMEMTSEHSFCLEISEKTYDICELLAFRLGKMPGFTWGAAEQMSFAAGGGERRKNKSAGI